MEVFMQKYLLVIFLVLLMVAPLFAGGESESTTTEVDEITFWYYGPDFEIDFIKH